MLLSFLGLALAADPPPREHHVIPWGTVTAVSTVDTAWAFGTLACETGAAECDGPRVGGSLALMAGPAVLLESHPVGATKQPGSMFPEGGRIDAGLSAGVLLRVDTPRAYVAGETFSQTWGGYFRLGQMDEAGVESRHTLAVGWRRAEVAGGAGQVDVALLTERRILPFVGIGANVRCAFGNEQLPWSVGVGAAVMVGM